MKRFALLSIIILMKIGLMHTQVYPCRPLITEDCGTTPLGKPALELSVENSHMENNDKECMLCSVFNYGLGDKIDAGFELPCTCLKLSNDTDENGIGDIVLRMKYRLLDETESRPSPINKTDV